MLNAKEIFQAFWWKNWMVFLSFFVILGSFTIT